MRNGWKRVGAAVGIVAVLGLAACEAEVDPEGDGVNVDVDTSPAGEDDGTE